MRLPELIGNEELLRQLGEMAVEDRLHTCLIFEGPLGVGKAATARWLARLSNCEAAPEQRPCEQCWSCRQIARSQHPDVIEIGLDPERAAPVISVEQARGVVSRMAMRPYNARRRYVIFDPADAMGPEAANALLKTFEEPPTATGFVLVTAAVSRLLPTIRSRSQRVRFGPVAEDRLVSWLEARGVADATALALLAEGCPGRALTLAEGEVERWRRSRDELLQAVAGSMGQQFAYADALTRGERSESTPRVEASLDALSRLLVDVSRARAGGSVRANADIGELVRRWAGALDESTLAVLGQSIERTRRDLEGYVNARLLVESLLASLGRELGAARGGARP